MKCQNLFSGKNKKNVPECCLLKILPRGLSINKPVFMCVGASFSHFWGHMIKMPLQTV